VTNADDNEAGQGTSTLNQHIMKKDNDDIIKFVYQLFGISVMCAALIVVVAQGRNCFT